MDWNESSQGIVVVDDLRLHLDRCVHYPDDPNALHDFKELGSKFSLITNSVVDWDTMSVNVKPDHTLGTMTGEDKLIVL